MKGYTIQNSINLLEKQVKDLEATPAGGGTAADVSYDNTSSHLTADDVQEAIDELNNDISLIDSKLGFGTPIVDTDLSEFDSVNDTYMFIKDGIAIISCVAGADTVRVTITRGATEYFTYANSIGATGSIVIPVKTGDIITISVLTNATIPSIILYPLNVAPVVTNSETRKRNRRNNK